MILYFTAMLCLCREKEGKDREGKLGEGRRREQATECPKPLEQGIFLVDWAIHSQHVTLNFFHYKTLLPSPVQRQIACTYFTQWNIASPLKQSFSSQSCKKKNVAVISLCSQCMGYSFLFFVLLANHINSYYMFSLVQCVSVSIRFYSVCVHTLTVCFDRLIAHYWSEFGHLKENKNQFVTASPQGFGSETKVWHCILLVTHDVKRRMRSLWTEPVARSLILSCILCLSITHTLTAWLCVSDKSDRAATKIDGAQIENRGRMAIMSSWKKHVSAHCNTKAVNTLLSFSITQGVFGSKWIVCTERLVLL